MSEGLIFRHFKNKQGLLDAIMDDAKERTGKLFGPILMETEPKEVLRKVIKLPLSISQYEYNFWRLQFKLEWEIEEYSGEKMQPLLDKLTWALHSLDHKKPAMEAQEMMYIMEGISSEILKGTHNLKETFEKYQILKYKQ
ncbi:hypothetical protein KH5_22230 [Urechidicola sp. KH5]